MKKGYEVREARRALMILYTLLQDTNWAIITFHYLATLFLQSFFSEKLERQHFDTKLVLTDQIQYITPEFHIVGSSIV